VPIGGLKVAYELANGLTDRGHSVSVMHLRTIPTSQRGALLRDLRVAAWRYGLGGWFDIRRSVTVGFTTDPFRLGPADHLVAVGWRSVDFVLGAPPQAGRPAYLAMDYMADFEGDPGDVATVWRKPIHKIVTASWLVSKAREISGDDAFVSQIHLAVGAEFTSTLAPADRQPTAIATYFHPAPRKGFRETMAALALVRARHPIQLTVFGGSRPEISLPGWARFVERPGDLVPIYNSAAIFVHASSHEGFGLPPAEAMASGCALAAFANQGVLEYAVDGRNAMLVPVGDVPGLAEVITRLIESRELRLRIAQQADEDMRDYNWARSTDEFEAALLAVG
jgi:glycosyltransferase involved in cell wall biosynthesis